jgi:NADH-quinone oxidoreductase subunit C
MLPEELRQLPTPAALEDWDPAAITGGSQTLGEVLLWVVPEKIAAVCGFLRDQCGYERLSGVTCIDRYPMEPRFEVVYLLHSVSRNERIKLKVALPGEGPEVESVCGVYAGANWYEREAYDLFGVVFRNHPDLRRIMMPDNWKGHPLRRDFPVHGHKYSYQQD